VDVKPGLGIKRMLRRIFKFKRVDVTGVSRKQNNEELKKLCSSLNTILIGPMKSRRRR
jgi:hypothetical protein